MQQEPGTRSFKSLAHKVLYVLTSALYPSNSSEQLFKNGLAGHREVYGHDPVFFVKR